MEFALVCVGLIVGLGVIAWIANHFDKGDDTIQVGSRLLDLHCCSGGRLQNSLPFGRKTSKRRCITQ